MIALIQSLKEELTVVLVEHDMEAVFALADRMTVLVQGAVLATGSVERSAPMPRSSWPTWARRKRNECIAGSGR
jgi:ABC-type branched-subunit amino acid transport system ATPase component